MKTVYLRKGRQLLPGMTDIGDMIHRGERIPIDLTPISEVDSLGLTRFAGYLPLAEYDFKKLQIYKTLKKTSEKQSRWLVHAGYETWKMLYDDQKGDPDTGLFMGLATVGCEDDTPMYCFEKGDAQTVSTTMLRETKPLSGITLLNTTACSHLATELQITGPNAAFSPHADAGAAALIEAYFTIAEGRCSRALCGAGSQKISPWYFLEYESLLTRYDKGFWFPVEGAAFVGMESEDKSAEAVLLSVMRSYACGAGERLLGLDRFLSQLRKQNMDRPGQIIYCGSLSYSDPLKACAGKYFDATPQVFLDTIIGYAGPASTLLSVNLAIELLRVGVVIDQNRSSWSMSHQTPGSVLVIAFGLDGQAAYLLLGNPL